MTPQTTLKACLLILLLPAIILASAAQELQQASDAGAVAFLLVTDMGTPGIEQARQMVSDASSMINAKSTIIELDRSDQANSGLVTKYRLSTAPVPLVLVFADNGVLAGGSPTDKSSSEKITQLVPTAKKAEVLKAIQSKNSVFITASRASMKSGDDILSRCAMACWQMNGKAQIIQIDMDDVSEQRFLQELKIDLASVSPVTVVINSKGQVTDKLTGAVDVGNLVQAANKVASSSCCPAGSGKTCGPATTTKK